MNSNIILVVNGEPNSIFSEIFIKSINKAKVKNPIIYIFSEKLLKKQMKKLNLNKKIHLINIKKINDYKLNNNSINLINIDYKQKKPFEKITNKSQLFLKKSFDTAFKIIKREKIVKLINGPISKKNFLNKKYLGITEYISDYFSKKNTCMLIFNKKLSVCPLTTHLPIKLVSKKINKLKLRNKIILIQDFYKKFFNKKPRIGVLGLNPHCESILQKNEDDEVIKPVVKNMKKINYKISGPIPADTAF